MQLTWPRFHGEFQKNKCFRKGVFLENYEKLDFRPKLELAVLIELVLRDRSTSMGIRDREMSGGWW